MTTTTTRPLVLNVTEAGNLLGVSRSTAYELVRSGDLDSVQLRRRVVVPVAVVADRLGITVPDVWLALRRRGGVAPVELEAHDRPAPDVLIEDVPEDIHAELTRRAQRRNQSLQQFLQAELERLASSATEDDVPRRIEGVTSAVGSGSPQPWRAGETLGLEVRTSSLTGPQN